MEKILVVDDDIHIAELVSLYLNKDGFEAIEVYDGKEVLDYYNRYLPSLIILDVMLPSKDGFSILRDLREISQVPVIMLTARGETFDKVLGLELGSDDYIVKPFEPKELVARVKAVLRRYSDNLEKSKNRLAFENLIIDTDNYTVTYHSKPLDMPLKEFELLSFLAKSPNHVFTRDQLLDSIWGYEYVGDTRTIDVHIKRIREKFNKNDSWSLKTIRGVGYKFEV